MNEYFVCDIHWDHRKQSIHLALPIPHRTEISVNKLSLEWGVYAEHVWNSDFLHVAFCRITDVA